MFRTRIHHTLSLSQAVTQSLQRMLVAEHGAAFAADAMLPEIVRLNRTSITTCYPDLFLRQALISYQDHYTLS